MINVGKPPSEFESELDSIIFNSWDNTGTIADIERIKQLFVISIKNIEQKKSVLELELKNETIDVASSIANQWHYDNVLNHLKPILCTSHLIILMSLLERKLDKLYFLLAEFKSQMQLHH